MSEILENVSMYLNIYIRIIYIYLSDEVKRNWVI